MNRRTRPASRAAVLSTAVATLALATCAHAADLFWQGGTADLGSANYFEPISTASNQAPGESDSLYIGADGTATRSTDLSVGRIIVGHDGNTTASAPGAFPGAGAVDVTGGNLFTTTGSGVIPVVTPPLNASPDSGLIIGHSANGSFSITNASVTVNDTVVVGYSQTDSAVTGSLSVNTGGSLTLTAGGLQIGANGTAALAGAGGTMTVAGGNVNIAATGADLVIGVWNRSTFVQTGGTVSVADETFVGRRNADASSFTLSGGTLNTRNFNVADTQGDGRIDNVTASVTNASLNVSGAINISERNSRTTNVTFGDGANVSVNGAISLAGTGNATTGLASAALDTTLTITGSANVTAGGAINLAATGLATGVGTRTALNVSGSAVLNAGANLNVGSNQSVSTSATISGSATVTAQAVLVGNRSSRNASLTVSETGTLNTRGNLVIGDQVGTAVPDNSSLTISDNAVVNVGAIPGVNAPATGQQNLFLGRGNSTNTTFNMSGNSSLYIDDLFLMSTAALVPTNVVANQSGGTITIRIDLRVNDTGGGDSTYNFSGGTINTADGAYVGRQRGLGTFNQSGGTANHGGAVRIGDAQNAPTDKALWATGVYNISGGTLNATATSPAAALTIAPQGAGTFRVIGDDSIINLTGDVLVHNTPADDTFPAFVGALAFQLESGDAGLSTVAATGIATFAAGSVLQLDFNAVEPVQGVYNALTAADIINDGLVPSLPAGWNYQIVPSAGGETLRFIAGDLNSDGQINADDFALIDRGRAMALAGGANGDLNADGTIDAEDYFLIDSAYGVTNTLSPGFLAARASDFGDAYVASLIAAVPEPSLAVCGLALLPLGRRRTRR